MSSVKSKMTHIVSKAQLVLGVVLACTPGCSLLFDEAPIDGCGPSLSGTIGYFSVDNDQGTILTDERMGIVAQSVAAADGTPFELATIEGPPGCQNAVSVQGAQGGVVTLDSDAFRSATSIDFWFKSPQRPFNTNTVGLLTKDGQNNDIGDVGIYLFAPSRDTPELRVLLRLQDATDTYFACSLATLAKDEWHHVAVSFDSADGVVMYVDGVTADSGAQLDGTALGNADCGTLNEAARATLEQNRRGWLWGASNASAPDTAIGNAMIGAVDELRFRSEKFTIAEAQDVYRAVIQR